MPSASSLARRQFLQKALAAASMTTVAGRAAHGLATAPTRPVKYAMCNETFGDWSFPRAFELVAECGYEGIEIAPFTLANNVHDVSAARRAEVRKQAKAAGLEVVGLHWLLSRTKGLHLTSPDADTRRRTADYLGALAKFCADMGGKLLVFGSPQQRNLPKGVSFEQGVTYAAEVIDRALPQLEAAGVRLALEPLSPKTTTFLRNAAEAVQLIERVDDQRCRLILDCLAMSGGETEPHAKVIEQYKKYLVHFHANDPNRQGPGFGELDFLPIVKSLRQVEFSGWVSVEVFDYSPGPEKLARQSITYLKKCFAEVDAP